MLQNLLRKNEFETATLTDPVNKLRVCTPQNLIDTKFGYTLQQTKWESLHLVNNVPCVYDNGDEDDISVESWNLSDNGFLYVSTTNTHPFIVGSPVFVHGTNTAMDGVHWVISCTVSQFVIEVDSYTVPSTLKIRPGKLYRHSMFSGNDLESISIHDGSKLKVTTKHPHGLSIGTRFVLANSKSVRSLSFKSSDVIVGSAPVLTETIAIDTRTVMDEPNGYLWKPVVPYDWQALHSVFFVSSNVNLYFSGFNVQNHNFDTGDYVMYVPPIGDQVIGGLQAYDVYHVVKHDDSSFWLHDVITEYQQGLRMKQYEGETPLIPQLLPAVEGIVTDMISNSESQSTYEYIGWFKPDADGTWTFSGGQGTQFDIAGVQGSGYISLPSLIANQYYKLKITCVGPHQIKFKSPTDSDWRISGSNIFFYMTNNYTPSSYKTFLASQGTSNLGRHCFMKVYLVTSADKLNDTYTLSSSLPGHSRTICLFSRGWGLDNAQKSISNISHDEYTKYHTEINGNNIRISSSETNSFNNITVNYINDISWVVPIKDVPEYDTLYHINHGFKNGDLVQYDVLSGTGPTPLTTGTYYTEVVSDCAFRLKTSLHGPTIDIKTVGNGTIRFIKTTQQEHLNNTVYIKNHGLLNNTMVELSGNSYYIINSSKDRFRLTTQQGSLQHVITPPTQNSSYQMISHQGVDSNKWIMTHAIDKYTFILSNKSNNPTLVPRKIGISGVLLDGIIISPNHGLRNDTKVTYRASQNTAAVLDLYLEYNVSRLDQHHFSIQGLVSNTGFTNVDDHWFETNEVMSYNEIHSTASYDSNELMHDDIYLEGVCAIQQPVKVDLDTGMFKTTIQSIDIDLNICSLSDDVPTGTWTHALVNGVLFYVTLHTSSTITFHSSPTDSTSQPVTNGSSVTLFRIGTVWTTSVLEYNTNTLCTTSTKSPKTTLSSNLLIETSLRLFMDGDIIHRIYDGGLELIPSSSPNSQVIRQTRKYIMYQSGKGIQVSNAVNFSTAYTITSATRRGSFITIVTHLPHRLQSGITITVSGCWDGDYQVIQVLDPYTFRIAISGDHQSLDTVATSAMFYTIKAWSNTKLRVGLFDEQNGLFFEYDGSKLYTVKRNSITIIPGTCTVVNGDARIVSDSLALSRYTLSLVEGDKIVIRGVSYRVSYVANDSTFYIQPSYHGNSATNVVIHKTIDYRTEQSQWSLDRCDGSGLTQFSLDIHKIQMFYIDYSWYGAGKVRYGVKGTSGDVRYVHEYLHNNRNNEAFMRSGNLPARYEACTMGIPTYTPSLVHWGTSVIMDGGYDRDNSCIFAVNSPSIHWYGVGSHVIELASDFIPVLGPIMYDITRCQSVQTWKLKVLVLSHVATLVSGTPLIASSGLATGTKLIGHPIPSEEGSASGYIFIDREPLSNVIQGLKAETTDDVANLFFPLLSLRMAPCVHEGRPAKMGIGEIVNRMQIVMKMVNMTTTHTCELHVLYNAKFEKIQNQWSNVYHPSLSQSLYHDKYDVLHEQRTNTMFKVRCNQGSSRISLEDLPPLSNSILGGNDKYPEGPDIVTLAVKIMQYNDITIGHPLTATACLSWYETEGA